MLTFGLTGGIATGKSTVSARFAARGVPIVDADRIAREVVAPGTAGLAALCTRFGDAIVFEDGTLDRKKLARQAFADPAALADLNAIVLPRIAAQGLHEREELAAAGHDLACYDAALLVENGLADVMRPLVVVLAPVELQRARVLARDGLPAEQVDQRIAAQASNEHKRALADYVIDNTGSLDALYAEADRVLDAICSVRGLPLRPPAQRTE